MKRLLWTSAVATSATAAILAWVPQHDANAGLPVVNVICAAPPTGAKDPRALQIRERAGVKSALAWLARRQEDNGSWKATAQPDHGFERLYEPDAAKESTVMATACALLAFISDGNSPWVGPYRESVDRGWKWLIAEQEASFDGLILPQLPDEEGTTLSEKERIARKNHVARLNHLWGTVALLEVVVTTSWDDPELDATIKERESGRRRQIAAKPAEAAIKFITMPDTDKAERYEFLNPKTDNMDELVLLGAIRYVFGGQILSGDKPWFKKAEAALTQLQVGQSEMWVPWKYSIDGEYWFRGSISTPQMLISPIYYRSTAGGAYQRMKDTIPLILANPPVWNTAYEIGRPSRHPEMAAVQVATIPVDVPESLRAVYTTWRDDIANEAAWFWSMMAFRSFGDGITEYQAMLLPILCDNQQLGGPEAGSWDPAGPHGRVFGREIATAWNSITLNMHSRLAIAQTHWTELMIDPRIKSRSENLDGIQATREACLVCQMEVMSTTNNSLGRGSKKFYFCSEEHMHHFEMNEPAYMNGTPPPIDNNGPHGGHK